MRPQTRQTTSKQDDNDFKTRQMTSKQDDNDFKTRQTTSNTRQTTSKQDRRLQNKTDDFKHQTGDIKTRQATSNKTDGFKHQIEDFVNQSRQKKPHGRTGRLAVNKNRNQQKDRRSAPLSLLMVLIKTSIP